MIGAGAKWAVITERGFGAGIWTGLHLVRVVRHDQRKVGGAL